MKKGVEPSYAIGLIFAFILGVGSLVILYSDFEAEKTRKANFDQLSNLLGLPEEFTSKVISGEPITGSISLVSLINDDNTKGFVIESTGTLPLTGFMINIDGQLYKPYASPGILLHGDRAVILLERDVWENIINTEKATITTRQNINLVVFALGTK